jgi:hypothetical protein
VPHEPTIPMSINFPDIMISLMTEIAGAAGEQRQAALEERLWARTQAKMDMMNQAKEIRYQANALLDGAVIAGVMTVVGGALTSAGRVLQPKESPLPPPAPCKSEEELAQVTACLVMLKNLKNSFNEVSKAAVSRV